MFATPFRHPSFTSTDHRPYLVPERPWAMSMVWHDLLFMHWAVDARQLRKAVPAPFELDLWDGQAWLGVVPFRMTGVRPRCVPAIPERIGNSNPSCFLELNLRTYVRVHDKPGVLFFSLDAESRFAVRMARRFFHLPYFDAEMSCRVEDDGWFNYQSRRTHARSPAASFSARYRPLPDSPPQSGGAGTLEHFLTERYCLYVLDRNQRPLRGEIHHRPWPLQTAEAQIECLDMTAIVGMKLNARPQHCHFAKRLRVVAWLNQAIR